MSYQNKKIVETLLSLRKNNRLSQKEVGEKIGMSQQTISDIENFKHTIDDEILYKYAMTFNVSADYILGLVSEPTTKLELKYFCKHTGLNEKTVELLNECVTREANGFIDFLKMLIYRIATNDTLLFDFDDVRENKTTYILTAKSLITKDISKLNNKQLDFVDALGTIERLKNDGHIRAGDKDVLEMIKYTTNGLSYEITNAINRIFEMFTLSNSGYNIKEFNELQRELKRGGENE